jgi:hypothetical protein
VEEKLIVSKRCCRLKVNERKTERDGWMANVGGWWRRLASSQGFFDKAGKRRINESNAVNQSIFQKFKNLAILQTTFL